MSERRPLCPAAKLLLDKAKVLTVAAVKAREEEDVVGSLALALSAAQHLRAARALAEIGNA